MADSQYSLLAGRNSSPLDSSEIRRVTNVFLGLDNSVNVRYDPQCRTKFQVSLDETNEPFGEIVFGPDIYPGTGIVDPNSALSLDAAAAHELTHYHRWKDKSALEEDSLEHLDEALTSLQAIARYEGQLSQNDVRQLVSDAAQRIQLFIHDLSEAPPSSTQQTSK